MARSHTCCRWHISQPKRQRSQSCGTVSSRTFMTRLRRWWISWSCILCCQSTRGGSCLGRQTSRRSRYSSVRRIWTWYAICDYSIWRTCCRLRSCTACRCWKNITFRTRKTSRWPLTQKSSTCRYALTAIHWSTMWWYITCGCGTWTRMRSGRLRRGIVSWGMCMMRWLRARLRICSFLCM